MELNLKGFHNDNLVIFFNSAHIIHHGGLYEYFPLSSYMLALVSQDIEAQLKRCRQGRHDMGQRSG